MYTIKFLRARGSEKEKKRVKKWDREEEKNTKKGAKEKERGYFSNEIFSYNVISL